MQPAHFRYKTVSEQLAASMIHGRTEDGIKWTYVDGLGLECIYQAGKITGHDQWKDWVIRQFDRLVHEDGTIDGYGTDAYSLDMSTPGKALFAIYAETGDGKFRAALDMFYRQLELQPRTRSGGYWHKGRYPDQMWLDGLYMYARLKVRYALEFLPSARRTEEIEDLVHQFSLLYRHVYDPDTGLLFHAWDESTRMPWADKDTGQSPCIWGRAMGWYCMALVDVIECLGIGDCDASPSLFSEYREHRQLLTDIARALADTLPRWQDPSGLWWQIMNQADRPCNYLESSCSSMFAYFLLKMARIIPGPDEASRIRYTDAGRAAYYGLLRDKVIRDQDGTLHLESICRGAGLGKAEDHLPYRDGTFLYYCTKEPIVRDNWQGMGPLLLASLETEWLRSQPEHVRTNGQRSDHDRRTDDGSMD